ncbi:cysteine--tRNA ligase 2, cytoplasmic [Tanacetum coccineum]
MFRVQGEIPPLVELLEFTYAKKFDIHNGGMHLMFPNHENEIAQSCAANPNSNVKYWMHNGFVIVNSEKMSKSRDNFFTIHYLTKETDKRNRKVVKVTEQLDLAQAANAEMEVDLRRLKVQSDQWRKAAEAADLQGCDASVVLDSTPSNKAGIKCRDYLHLDLFKVASKEKNLN